MADPLYMTLSNCFFFFLLIFVCIKTMINLKMLKILKTHFPFFMSESVHQHKLHENFLNRYNTLWQLICILNDKHMFPFSLHSILLLIYYEKKWFYALLYHMFWEIELRPMFYSELAMHFTFNMSHITCYTISMYI